MLLRVFKQLVFSSAGQLRAKINFREQEEGTGEVTVHPFTAPRVTVCRSQAAQQDSCFTSLKKV